MTPEPTNQPAGATAPGPLARRMTIVIVALAIVALATPAAAAAKACDRVYVPSVRARAKVRVVRGPMSCGAAHRQIAAAFDAERSRHWNGTGPYGVYWRVHGWRCTIGLGGSETFCRRAGRQVDGSFRRDDGWIF